MRRRRRPLAAVAVAVAAMAGALAILLPRALGSSRPDDRSVVCPALSPLPPHAVVAYWREPGSAGDHDAYVASAARLARDSDPARQRAGRVALAVDGSRQPSRTESAAAAAVCSPVWSRTPGP